MAISLLGELERITALLRDEFRVICAYPIGLSCMRVLCRLPMSLRCRLGTQFGTQTACSHHDAQDGAPVAVSSSLASLSVMTLSTSSSSCIVPQRGIGSVVVKIVLILCVAFCSSWRRRAFHWQGRARQRPRTPIGVQNVDGTLQRSAARRILHLCPVTLKSSTQTSRSVPSPYMCSSRHRGVSRELRSQQASVHRHRQGAEGGAQKRTWSRLKTTPRTR